VRALNRPSCIFIAIGLSVAALAGGCTRRSDSPNREARLTAASPSVGASPRADKGKSTSGSDTGRPPTGHDSGRKGGGGGPPISIPDIIIAEGQNVYTLKKLIEKFAVSQCGYRCITVQIKDVDENTRLSGSEGFPPIVQEKEKPGSPLAYTAKRGTRIVLHGNQEDLDKPADEATVSPSPSASSPGE
jgi:hypothetical protein